MSGKQVEFSLAVKLPESEVVLGLAERSKTGQDLSERRAKVPFGSKSQVKELGVLGVSCEWFRKCSERRA